MGSPKSPKLFGMWVMFGAHGMRINNTKRKFIYTVIIYLAVLAILTGLLSIDPDSVYVFTDDPHDWNAILGLIFAQRDGTLLSGDTASLKGMFVQGEQNSKWALELETNRANYIKEWSQRQGVKFTGIISVLDIRKVRKVGRGFAFYVIVSTTYKYSYEGQTDRENTFRIGTYHSLDLIPGSGENTWLISREWYLDPFQDSLNQKTLANDDIRNFVLSQSERDFSGLNKRRIKAVAYADRWAGAATDGTDGYSYNKDYPNYSGRGGDCSNYVSQAIHESGFRATGGWGYTKDSASRSWCNASGLESYLVYSGKAYVLAKGTYTQVYKEAYKLVPGDAIAYQEKGKVVHMAIVTGADSKGYTLVNTHTTDRFHVPWDLGWNDSDIKFFLLKMNYPS